MAAFISVTTAAKERGGVHHFCLQMDIISWMSDITEEECHASSTNPNVECNASSTNPNVEECHASSTSPNVGAEVVSHASAAFTSTVPSRKRILILITV